MKKHKDISKIKVIEEAEKQELERSEVALEKERILKEQIESEENEAKIENLILKLNGNNVNVEITKNKDYIIKIDGYGHEGEGVGKINNFTIFVKGAIKGETVKIKLIKVSKTYGIGKLLEVIIPSKNRTEAICPIYKRCGGCNLQHISYEEQLNFKTQRVKDVIERVGKVQGVKVHNTIGMDFPYNYRNKVQLPVGDNDGNIIV